MQDGVDGALGRDAQVAVQAADQQFPNLARTPMGLLVLEPDDEALDLGRELIGIAYRPARAIAQRLAAMLLVPREDLVAGLARDAKLPADVGHRLAVKQLDDKPHALVHHRTLLPRHRHLPLECGKCYPCVRYVLLPMSRVAHDRLSAPVTNGARESVAFNSSI